MNLTHWNLAEDFSIYEVACLSCGVEPSDKVTDPRVKSIDRLLRDAYRACREECQAILDQNESDRASGVEESTPAYMADAFEGVGLASRDLRNSFAEALRDPENAVLVAVEDDSMRFTRPDLQAYFESCEFEPDLRFYNLIKVPVQVQHTTPRTGGGSASDEHKAPASDVQQAAPSTERGIRSETRKDPGDIRLATRERNVLLCMIAALCDEVKIDYSKPTKSAALIQNIAARMGVSIGQRTIEEHLKKIPDALRTRMK